MSDWRTGLEFVPLIVLLLIIFMWVAVGAFGGYKRALYWGVGNIVLFLIGMIFAATLSKSLATSLVKWIKLDELVPDFTKDQWVQALTPYMGIIFYLFFLIFGNPIILTPLYYPLFKRIFKIGCYDPRTKAYAKRQAKLKAKGKTEKLDKQKHTFKWSTKKYTIISRVIATPSAFLLSWPMFSSITELSMAATVTYDAAQKGYDKGIYAMTNGFNDLFPYCDHLLINTDALISGLMFATGTNSEDETYITSLENAFTTPFNKLSDFPIDKPTTDAINDVVSAFNNFSVTDASTVENYINSFTRSDDYRSLVQEIVNTQIESSGTVSKADWDTFSPFIGMILYGGNINTYDEPNQKFGLANVDPLNNANRLNLTNTSYDFLQELFPKLMFDLETGGWTNQDEINKAIDSVLSLFVKISDKSYTSAIEHIGTVINPDTFVSSILGGVDLSGEGTKASPYIIPLPLFYKTSDGSKTAINNDYQEDPANPVSIYWSFYPVLTNERADPSFTWVYRFWDVDDTSTFPISNYFAQTTNPSAGAIGFTPTETFVNSYPEWTDVTGFSAQDFRCHIVLTDKDTGVEFLGLNDIYFRIKYVSPV